MNKSRVLKRLNLDEVEELRNQKHSDYIILTEGNTVIVVEETGRPEIRDLEKLETTIVWLRCTGVQKYFNVSSNQVKFIAVLHFKRGDAMVNKYAMTLTRTFKKKYSTRLLLIKCSRESEFLEKLLTA